MSVIQATTSCRYALVTGASEGLGRAFALSCARRGYGLVLVSLPGTGLPRLAVHIEAHYNVPVHVLELDLCQLSSVDQIRAFLDELNLPLSLLINNAGYGLALTFEEMDQSALQRQLQLNITCLVHLTHTLLPRLRAHRPAHILNMSSLAGFYALPYKSVYGATKAYIRAFSLAIRSELWDSGVRVSVACPSGLNTNLRQFLVKNSGNWISRQTWMEADEAADYCLHRALRGQAIIIPGRLNRWIYRITAWLPNFIQEYAARKTMKQVGQPKVRFYTGVSLTKPSS